MKILFVTQSNKKYGIEVVMKTLIDKISDQGYKIGICYVEKSNRNGIELGNDIEQYFLNRENKAINGILEITKKVKKIVLEESYDIVYSAGTYCNIVNCLLKLLCRKKHILSEHNLMSISIQSESKAKLMSFLVKRLYKYSDKVIAVSPEIAKDLSKNYSIKDKKIAVLPNPIDSKNVIEKSNKDNENKNIVKNFKDENYITLCNIAHFKKAKNHLELAKAIKLLKEQDKKVKLILIGDGSLYNEIEEYIKLNNLKKEILLLGYTDNPFNILKDCDGFILPSLWEGFGLVLIEAMFLGIPCITTNHSGAKFFIKNNENGLICGHEYTQIAKRISEFIDLSKADKEKIIENGYRTANKFEAISISKKYIEVFKS